MADKKSIFSFGQSGIKDVQSQITNLKGTLSSLNRTVENVGSSFESLKNIAIGAFIGSNLAKSIAGYQKSLYDMSRSASFAGQSFGQLKVAMESTTRQTTLNKKEVANLFQTMMDSVRGIKLSASSMSDFAKVLTREFGPSLEEAKEAFADLAEVQREDIFLFERLRKGLPTAELNKYVASLIMSGNVTEKQVRSIYRAAEGFGKHGVQLTNEDKRLRAYRDSVQELEKTWENLKLDIGAPTIKALTSMSKGLAEILKYIAEIINKSPDLQKTLSFAPYVIAATSLMSLAGSLLYKFISLKNILSEVSKETKAIADAAGSAAGGGTPAILGGTGRSSIPFLGRVAKAGIGISAGLAIGYGGIAAGQAVGGRGGSAISATGRMADYAVTGASIGSIFPGLGTAIGGITGAAIGLIASFDDLSEAITGNKAAQEERRKKRIEDYEKNDLPILKREAKKVNIDFASMSEQWKQIREWSGVNPKSEFEKMNFSSQMEAIRTISKIQETEDIFGVNRSDPQSLGLALAAQKSMMEKMEVGSGPKSGESTEEYEKRRKEAKSKIVSAIEGEGGIEGANILKSISKMKREELAKFTKSASFELNMENIEINDQTMDQFEKLLGEKFSGAMTRVYAKAMDLSRVMGKIVSDQSEIAEYSALYEGKISQSIQTYRENLAIDQQRLVLLRGIQKFKEDNIGEDDSEADAKNKYLEFSKLAGKSDVEARKEAEMLLALMRGTLSIAVEEVKVKKDQVTQYENMSRSLHIVTNQLDLQANLLDQQISLFRAANLGLGPSLDMQMQMLSVIEQQKAAIDSEIEIEKKRLEENKNNIDAQNKIIERETKKLALQQKGVELTKTLREGYLDAMSAMSNAEGTFSKMITSRDLGAAEMMRTFATSGGARLGALGAGGNSPVIQYGTGGRLMFRGDWNALNKGYGTFYNNSQMLGPNAAGLVGETGTGDYFTGTGQSVYSRGNFGRGSGGTSSSIGRSSSFGGISQSDTSGIKESKDILKDIDGTLVKILGKLENGIPVGSAVSGKVPGTTSPQTEDSKNKEKAKDAAKTSANTIKNFSSSGILSGLADSISNQMMSGEFLQIALESFSKTQMEEESKKLEKTSGFMENVNTSNILRKNGGFSRGVTLSGSSATGQMVNTKEEADYQRERERGRLFQKSLINLQEQGLNFNTAFLKTSIDMKNEMEKSSQELVSIEKIGNKTNDIMFSTNDLTKQSTGLLMSMNDISKKSSTEQKEAINSIKIADVPKMSGDSGVGSIGFMSGNLMNWMSVGSWTGAGKVSSHSDSIYTSGKSKKKARGGWIPGSGSGDVIPALLEPGEFVINKRSASTIGPLLDAINSNRFQRGGPVGIVPPQNMGQGASGGFNPRFNFNIRGDSIRSIMLEVQNSLAEQLNNMMTGPGKTGRYDDLVRQ